MSLDLLPDVERLVSVFLRAQAEVTAIVSSRVYTELPRDRTFPLVRLTRVSGAPVMSKPLWLDAPRIQVECYGGPKATANRLAETCRAAIAARLPGTHTEGVVTGVGFGPMQWLPDVDVLSTEGVAQPRYLFDVVIWLHP